MNILSTDPVDFATSHGEVLSPPGQVLLATPTHFDVRYAINPYMTAHVGAVNLEGAQRQWQALRDAYTSIGIGTLVIEGIDGLCDMVFCANAAVPFRRPEDGSRVAVMSRMRPEQRRGEIPHFDRFLTRAGYETLHLPHGLYFEGMGDAIWHPGRTLLWGGYGVRSSRGAYDLIAEWLRVPVIPIELRYEAYYHLDTCFCPLDEHTVLLYPGAFQPHDLETIRRMFPHVIEAPESEAMGFLACNAHAPDGRHVLMQECCPVTAGRLEEAGFVPMQLDTEEFRKAGGSVACMKLALW